MDGLLLKRQQLRKGWPERHFTLNGTCLQYQYPGSSRSRTYSLTPQSTAACCVVDGFHCFKVSILSKAGVETMLLRPHSTKDQENICKEWVSAIETSIESTPGSNKSSEAHNKPVVAAQSIHFSEKKGQDESMTAKSLPFLALLVFICLIPTTLALMITSFALGAVATTFVMQRHDKTTAKNEQPPLQLGSSTKQASTSNSGNEEKYIQEAKTALEYLNNAAEDPKAGGWEAHSTISNVEIFLKKEGDYTFSMGKGVVDCPVHVLLKALQDLSNKPQMDPNWKSTKILCDLDGSKVSGIGNRVVRKMQVEYSDFKRIFPTTARDFCGVVIETFDK